MGAAALKAGHSNTIFSWRDLIDETGDVIQSYEFQEHGLPMPGSGAGTGTFSPKTYQGGLSVNDDTADSGLWLMGHRHFDSRLARFISRDPIGFAGGMNLFSGSSTSPVTFTDSSGLLPDPDALAPNPGGPVPTGRFPLGDWLDKVLPEMDGQKAWPGISGKPKSPEMGILKSLFGKTSGLSSPAGFSGGNVRSFPSNGFSNNMIILGLLFSLNRVAKADPCERPKVAAGEGGMHLGTLLLGAGLMSKPAIRTALMSPPGRVIAAGLIAGGSTRQFMTETETGQVAEQFWQDTFAESWACYYSD
jgi:RHS repeat-associated protein